jgi:hypothetical protein
MCDREEVDRSWNFLVWIEALLELEGSNGFAGF